MTCRSEGEDVGEKVSERCEMRKRGGSWGFSVEGEGREKLRRIKRFIKAIVLNEIVR